MVCNKIESVMKRGAKMRFAVLLGLVTLAVQQANAGSAVARDGNGHYYYSCGHSKEVDEQKALEFARRSGSIARIVAASDVAGYCAIASAEREYGDPQQRWVSGIALGHSSPEEAKRLAIQQCVKGGGMNPKIRLQFRG
jgi:hypothetical protein